MHKYHKFEIYIILNNLLKSSIGHFYMTLSHCGRSLICLYACKCLTSIQTVSFPSMHDPHIHSKPDAQALSPGTRKTFSESNSPFQHFAHFQLLKGRFYLSLKCPFPFCTGISVGAEQESSCEPWYFACKPTLADGTVALHPERNHPVRPDSLLHLSRLCHDVCSFY